MRQVREASFFTHRPKIHHTLCKPSVFMGPCSSKCRLDETAFVWQMLWCEVRRTIHCYVIALDIAWVHKGGQKSLWLHTQTQNEYQANLVSMGPYSINRKYKPDATDSFLQMVGFWVRRAIHCCMIAPNIAWIYEAGQRSLCLHTPTLNISHVMQTLCLCEAIF